MNIKDFLIDNYIWILVIILITIITIIGFLADKKKGGKKNENVPPVNPNLNGTQPNNMNQMQYQQPIDNMQNQMNNNMGMNYNNVNNTMQPMNSIPNAQSNQESNNMNNNINMVTEPQAIQQMQTPTGINLMNNPQPVENNIVQNVPQEPMYQPLSEQTPVIQPQPVPNFSNMTNNQEMSQPMDLTLNQNVSNINPMGVPTPVIQQPVEEQPIMQTPNYSNQVSMSQPMENNNNFGMQMGQSVPNFSQNNTTIPSPVSPIPVPQPVNPQPIMQNTYNAQPMPQSNFGGQMPQQTQQPIPQATSQPMPNQPINFVYGPQNNNQNM